MTTGMEIYSPAAMIFRRKNEEARHLLNSDKISAEEYLNRHSANEKEYLKNLKIARGQ